MTKKYNVVFTKSFLIKFDNNEENISCEEDALNKAFEIFERQLTEDCLTINDFAVIIEKV